MTQQTHAPQRPLPVQPTRDPLRRYAWGSDAARLFGVADAASVWRQIARHGADYPGEIEVVEVGRRKMVRRDQLVAFTARFAAGPGRNDTRIKMSVGVAEVEPVATSSRPAVSDERRAWLREQIARRMR